MVIGSVEINDNPAIDQSDFALARFKTDGTLDSSFADYGKLTTDFGTTLDDEGSGESRDEGYSVAVQKDGRIVAAGFSNGYLALVRYNTDGSLDNTFSDDGLLITSVYHTFGYPDPISIAFQDDNKIVVAGGFSVIARFNTDGSLDKLIYNETHFFDAVYSEAIQKDGKIIVADFSSWGLGLARYNTDGTLDTSFSADGIQQLDYGTEVVLQNDQKIVVAGDSIGGYFTIRRFNADGSFDNTFDKDGKQETNFGFGYNQPYAAAIQSDGKILVGGMATPYLAIARYNTNGSLDNTFDGDGKLIDSNHLGKTVFYTAATQKDGKIIAAGTTWNGNNSEFVIVRYNTDGSLDNTFSKNGIITTAIPVAADVYIPNIRLAIQSDGKIVVAGIYPLARYNADGSLDNTFANAGTLANPIISIAALAIQSDGKIVVAGGVISNDESAHPAIARYNADGSLDKTFGMEGEQTSPSIGSGVVRSIVIQNDGKIVLAIISYNDEGPYFYGTVYLERLNADGSIDSTFGDRGSIRAGGGTSCSLILQGDDKIIIAGNEAPHGNNDAFVRRYNINGIIDTSFKTYRSGGYNEETHYTSLALQKDGKIVVLGVDLLRLNADGTQDTTFSTNADKEADFVINDIAIANNKLYAVGGNYYGSVARYLLNANSNTPPTVTLTTPADNTIRLAPAAHIKLSAAAADKDGTITKVEFYNGTTLLHTETVIPYGYVWRNVPLGNYTLTAKAYDNSGNVTTSAPVHISVVPKKPPVVSITKPVNNRSFAAPGYIHLEAAASDTDGRVTNVKFYNGSSLLRTEYEYPYTYHWENVPVGTYTITAVATDNWGAHTTSAPVTIRVKSVNTMMVSNKPSENNKTAPNDDLRISVYPNPAINIVNIHTKGLQQSKPATLSIISVSGIVHTKVQTSSAAQIQLNVSTLPKGVYTIKIISVDKIMYKQFVKL